MAKKMLGAAALTAALAGGGALGALLGAPVISAAQDGSTTTTAPAATDDGSTTTTPPSTEGGSTTTPDDAKDCGDGVGGGRFGGGLRAGLSTAAEALGMTETELRDALRDGASIASIAEERGVDVQTVVDALVAEATARIDERVAAGDLDAERADELKAQLPERVQALVEREGGLRFGGHRGRGHGPKGADWSDDAQPGAQQPEGS